MKWEVSLKGAIEIGDGWSTLNITSATEWDLKPLCLVITEGSDPLTSAVIYVYNFSTPDIFLASEIVANRSEKIICNISSLTVGGSIPSSINISLSMGSSILNSSHGISSVEYSFVAKPQEDGDDILCVAYLQVASEVLEKSANRTLKIVASPYNVSISTNLKVYKSGASLVVKCHAEGKPFPEFSWDLPSKVGVEYSDGNKTITIHPAQVNHNGTYRCLVHNVYGNNSAKVEILYEEMSRSLVVVWVMVSLVIIGILGVIIWYCRK
ncbi:intercellular adhesion molecule 3-like isoform X2 [Rhineura floridana]|nr:intercellular adhesion molecule 3-like isoform X2 [Rhineura floridana]XP_061469730.1 intercellular adhesion molecule 3-like isoform X2 [Rhineura floridana]XP_061469731.1 intercellular adhesion molecule 3-like isoform X2 [Rhineura floridana]